MKILIDLTALDDNFSGIERYAASLALEMIKREEYSFILVFKNQVHPLFKKETGRSNVTDVVIKGKNKLVFNQIRLPLLLGTIDADYYVFLAFPVPILLFKRNMISTIHDISCWDCPETMKRLSKWYFRISHRIAMKKCRNIITISEFSKERIQDRLHYPEEKIWKIYCGTDDKFQNYIKEEVVWQRVREKYHLPKNYILSLSTLEPRKNLELLLKAYQELILKGKLTRPLLLAGRMGWNMEKLLDTIENTVREKIYITGFIQEEDIPYLYSGADFFVFSSQYEGFGLPPLEAMACGTPVLSSDAASLPEVLGDAAVYFKNNDLDSLKNALCNINNNFCKMRSKIGEGGRKQAEKYLWEREAGKLLRYLSE